MKRNFFKGGFTLVELMVVIGIFGILMVVGINIVTQVIQANNQSLVQNEVRQNVTLAIESISRDVRASACAVVSGTPPSSTLTLFSDRCSGSVLSTYSKTAGPNPLLQRGANPVTSSKIRITNLTFSATAPPQQSVTVTIGAAYNNAGGRWDFNADITQTETISLRQFSF